jgi:hypothetical protein
MPERRPWKFGHPLDCGSLLPLYPGQPAGPDSDPRQATGPKAAAGCRSPKTRLWKLGKEAGNLVGQAPGSTHARFICLALRVPSHRDRPTGGRRATKEQGQRRPGLRSLSEVGSRQTWRRPRGYAGASQAPSAQRQSTKHQAPCTKHSGAAAVTAAPPALRLPRVFSGWRRR